jgi:hypothetical protein
MPQQVSSNTVLILRRSKLYFYSIWYRHSLWAAVHCTAAHREWFVCAWLLPRRVFPYGEMHCRSAFKSTYSLKFFWVEPLWWNTLHNRRMFSVEPDRPLDLSSGMTGSDRTFSCPRPPHTVWQHSVVLAELPYYISRLIHKGIEINRLKSCNRGARALHKRGWSILLNSRENTQATLSFPTPFSLEDGASSFFWEGSNTVHFQMM